MNITDQRSQMTNTKKHVALFHGSAKPLSKEEQDVIARLVAKSVFHYLNRSQIESVRTETILSDHEDRKEKYA